MDTTLGLVVIITCTTVTGYSGFYFTLLMARSQERNNPTHDTSFYLLHGIISLVLCTFLALIGFLLSQALLESMWSGVKLLVWILAILTVCVFIMFSLINSKLERSKDT